MPVRIGETKNRHTRHQILNKIIILWAGAIIGGLRRGSRPRRVEQTEEQQEKKNERPRLKRHRKFQGRWELFGRQ